MTLLGRAANSRIRENTRCDYEGKGAVRMERENEVQIYVSVILPSLNVARYIRECIDSVRNQTMRQIEILCVDAGSTDGTLEILEKYVAVDARIRIINSDQKSYGHQVNLGIEAARGQYIGIVETDDFIDTIMYQNLYSYVGTDYPDFIKGGYYDYAEIENRKLICESSRDDLLGVFGQQIDLRQEREKGLLDLNHIWAGIYRRDFLLEKDIKFNETPGASYQDTSFSMLVGLLADTGVYVAGSYYYYRRDNANSSVKSSTKWRCVIDELEYVSQEIVKKEKNSEDIQQLIWKYKPIFYFWNYLRLPQKEREQFGAEICRELEKYIEDSVLYRSLSEGRKEMITVMKNPDISDAYLKKQKVLEDKYRALITLARKGEKCILISAGRYSERMLVFQDFAGNKYIDAVADNNIMRQGCEWNGYIIMSLSEAVHQYEKHWFIIANRRFSNELCNQLIGEGIPENKILIFDSILSVPEMIDLLAEKK